MTAHHSASPCPGAEVLAGFVLGDLEPHRRESAEAHLLTCEPCRGEVARLRDALFGLVERLPPAAAPAETWERLRARQAALPRPGAVSRGDPAKVAVWGRRWPLVAAVAAAFALGGSASWTLLRPTPGQLTQRWLAQGATPLTLAAEGGEAVGTLLLRADGQALVLLTREPPTGQVYQVWGQRRPATALPISLGMTEHTSLEVIRCTSYDSVRVSLEPVGGSPAPTGSVGRVRLPAPTERL